MKKYRLKQWYPSLYDDIEVGAIVDYDDGWIYYINKRGNKTTVEIDEEELSYEDFWELIEEKEPLFITEDGVDVVNGMRIHSVRKSNFDRDSYIVDEDFVKEQTSKHPYVYFFHESNADEYAWKNKRVFSYEDMMKAKHSILITNEDIEKSAKGRSKE